MKSEYWVGFFENHRRIIARILVTFVSLLSYFANNSSYLFKLEDFFF
ncbi:hypothetical protein CES85_0322 [Ochrobactrum quorumnocens]|uniref:Uncharacterized protein n=1 Tax=Ochrobactrum quorumnocens TaxID=271865 RepID=A0A248UEX7_9HYPH|nr:hypothetical protein CES85_0322 [[Ochrobactrum] quorumnocens]